MAFCKLRASKHFPRIMGIKQLGKYLKTSAPVAWQQTPGLCRAHSFRAWLPPRAEDEMGRHRCANEYKAQDVGSQSHVAWQLASVILALLALYIGEA